MQIMGNTALIPDGQNVAKTQEAIANLLENSKNNWISQVLTSCGVPKGQSVNINSATGEIVDTYQVQAEPAPNQTIKVARKK